MARQHPLRDAGLALSLLTVIPTRAKVDAEQPPQVAAWFPAIGALFGLVGYAMVHGAGALHIQSRAPFLVAAAVVIVWALLSRLLHWDGLADVADGFWGSHDRERRLEIMSDSHTGAFGATAVALVALAEVAAMGALIGEPHEVVVLLVPVVSRFSATAAAWLGTPARPGGLGRSVLGHPSTLSVLIALVPLAGAVTAMSIAYGVPGLLIGGAGLLVAFALPHVLSSRFGGVTGDVMGASVLITETIMFAAFALGV